MGATINYDTLVIATFNAAGAELARLKYAEHVNEITHSEISTAQVGANFVFTVTYTVNGKVFAANAKYEIVENTDYVVSSIKIIPGSVDTTYYVGGKVSYDNLQIYTYNKNGTQLSYLRYSSSKDSIVLTLPISTAQAVAGASFTVTYTNSDGSFSDTITYSVLDQAAAYVPVSWSMNDRYSAYLANKGASSEAKDGSNAFMGIAPFRLGTVNPVSLLPTVLGYDSVHKKTVEISDTSKISAKLAFQSDPTDDLNLADYFDDVSALTSGKVDFKDDKAGEYVLTYRYDGDSDVEAFPEISYNLSVVSGYNITTAKELSAMDNQEIYWTDNSALKTSLDNFRRANNIPATDFANMVFQNDILIKKSDLPDYFVWQSKPATEGGPVSLSMVGSLKNQKIVFGHIPTPANPVFNIYGNYHKVTLLNTGSEDDFPFVKETTDCTGTEPNTSVNVVPEAGLFGNVYDGADADTLGMKITLNDLSATGDQGISTDTVLEKGGVIFFKCHTDSLFNDIVANSFFTNIVNECGADYGGEKRKNANMTLINSRLHDTFSASLFNEYCATIRIVNSELTKAGGPLIINQVPTYDLSGKTEEEITSRRSVKIIVDAKSHLENWVTGMGGWFALYHTSAQMSNLSQFNGFFTGSSLKKTFVKTIDNSARFNMIGLNMRTAETIDKMQDNDGSLAASFTMAGTDWIDYEEGRAEVNEGVGKLSSDRGASYLGALASTDYGQLLCMQQFGLPIFKTVESSGAKHYMTMAFDVDSNPTALINAKCLADGATTALDGTAGESDYLSIYLLMKANEFNYNPARSTFASDFAAYQGVAPFGLILGLYDYSAE
jgi:hypothetical protein